LTFDLYLSMKLNAYQKTAIATVVMVIFAIFVGGLVRVSGSGLGCPDWPKCFGSWIPPLSASQLPAAFDPSQFNAMKMWTEYANRLVGIVTGFLIIATCLLSFRYRKKKPSVFYSSTAALLLVLFEGWIGGTVVESRLAEWLVTIHMLIAIALMAILIYATVKATEKKWSGTVTLNPGSRRWLFGVGIALFAFTIIQIILGTQTRVAFDTIMGRIPHNLWVANVGAILKIHRSFSWTVFLLGCGLVFLAYRRTESSGIRKLAVLNMAAIIAQIVLGAGLYYLGMPPALQILHVVVAAIMICFEFLVILAVRPSFSQSVANVKEQVTA
jgi:cytochrome c oxidase assembly protein subunit 15